MGCECGVLEENPEMTEECRESAMLEAPDWDSGQGRKKKNNNFRVVGGCPAPHTPWYVYLHITCR